MKAVHFSDYGSPDVIFLKEVAKPQPKEKEILIKIKATTVSAGDCRVRQFDVPPMFWLPGRLALGIFKPRFRPGMELAGVVEATGSGVTRFKVGDRVYGSTFNNGFGGNAEYKCLSEDSVVDPIPGGISYEEAAGVPIPGHTALWFLQAAGIKQGDRLLLNGASGSVGLFAIQVARYYGAHITAVCSRKNFELVKKTGAHECIDYNEADFADTGNKYDIVFDAVGTRSFFSVAKCLTPRGSFISAAMMILQALVLSLFTRRSIIGGTARQTKMNRALLNKLLSDGTIKPVIDKTFHLTEIQAAHSYVDTRRKRGNVVIKVA